MKFFRKGGSERGSNVVEFAMIFPVYILLIGLIFDYGIFFLRRASFTAVLTEGCREGAMVDANDDTQLPPATVATNYANSKLAGMGGATAVVVVVGTVPNRSLRCEIHEPYATVLVPSSLPLVPTSIDLISETRLEWQRSGA